jgi:quinolinate synthase
MAMNGLQGLAKVLETGDNEIYVEPDVSRKAVRCIERMLDFAAAGGETVRASGDLARDAALFSGVGPA